MPFAICIAYFSNPTQKNSIFLTLAEHITITRVLIIWVGNGDSISSKKSLHSVVQQIVYSTAKQFFYMWNFTQNAMLALMTIAILQQDIIIFHNMCLCHKQLLIINDDCNK